MTAYDLCFLGFGTVGKALAGLLASRRTELRERYDVEYRITGVASRRLGWIARASGVDLSAPAGRLCHDVNDWLDRARPHVVFEMIPLDPHTGQPALDYLRAALEHGAHAISANKGPLVHGYRELSRLADACGKRYLFESAVMDGAPVFSLARHCLPLAGLRAARGVFTSTATVVLEAVEEGLSIDEGIARAQQLGIAEADPGYDVDGWDTAVKLCAVANVLFGAALVPADVRREGIRSLDAAHVRAARRDGRPYRLIGRIAPDGDTVTARVAPERVEPGDPLGVVHGTTLVMHYQADVFPGGLTVVSHDPDPTTTAYGLFADFVSAIGALA